MLVLDRKQILDKDRSYWILRRTQDIILSTLAFLVLFPFMILIAIIIFIDDPHGSPIFSQTRVGRDGKPFVCFKFRSMCKDAEAHLADVLSENEMDGPAFKIKNDPRITRVGHVLRKVCLDELPQLINVIRGDMSIVGPRPPLPREVEQYNDYQKQRLYVTPGLTCYWQTQPCRNELTFDEWIDLDIKYIQERSFCVDWKIIFKTFGILLKCEGR